VVETVEIVGEMAKETVKGAWGAAEETTQKIKETAVGKDDDDNDDYKREKSLEYRRRAASGE
jgi:hypothetical protein